MERAIFLDRDGVINRETGNYITSPGDFEVLPGVGEALRILQHKGYKLIVITNQGGIDKGLYSHGILEEIHCKMKAHLAGSGVELTDIFYSPYHPDYTNSLSRKPDSLLLEKAIAKYSIDVQGSYLIGDTDRDIEAAKKVGVRGIKIASNTDLLTVIRQHIPDLDPEQFPD